MSENETKVQQAVDFFTNDWPDKLELLAELYDQAAAKLHADPEATVGDLVTIANVYLLAQLNGLSSATFDFRNVKLEEVAAHLEDGEHNLLIGVDVRIWGENDE